MKTSELTGAALDWAVAKCEYPNLVWGSSIGIHHASHQIVIPHLPEPQCYWNPSTDWPQGGPIIEREKIGLTAYHRDGGMAWRAEVEFLPDDDTHYRYGKSYGPTPLIAAMRCYVASKLGDNINIPEELC
jgi:hypothetical protein